MNRAFNKSFRQTLSAITSVLFMGQSLVGPTVFASDPQAWDTPKWGFKKSLSNSLVFDQSFDASSFRPFPIVASIAKSKLPTQAIGQLKKSEPYQLPSAYVLEALATREFASEVSVPAATPRLAPPTQVVSKLLLPNLDALKVVAQKSEPAPASTSVAHNSVSNKFRAPQPKANMAKVLVLDEDTLLLKEPKALADVAVHWIGENSGMVSRTNSMGVTNSPYPNTHSIRFIAKAPGYLPALGYAVSGLVTPIVLVHESKVPDLFKSLGLSTDNSQVIVLGQMLDKNYRPLSSLTVDTSSPSTAKAFYSAGSLGIFMAGNQMTGPLGNFLVSGLKTGMQYIMPTRNLDQGELKNLVDDPETGSSMKEWPAFIGSFEDSPQILSITLQEGTPQNLQTQLVDAFELVRPESGIHFTIGGQRGLFIPDDEGFVQPENFIRRSSVDLVEVQAQGYRKSWVSTVASKANFPNFIALFTDQQLQSIFSEVEMDVNLTNGLILGYLRPEQYTQEVQVAVYDHAGRRNKSAKIFYFDSRDNRVKAKLTSTDRLAQRFAVTNLEDGEWHIIATDAKTGRGVGVQVVRIEKGTISQIQF